MKSKQLLHFVCSLVFITTVHAQQIEQWSHFEEALKVQGKKNNFKDAV